MDFWLLSVHLFSAAALGQMNDNFVCCPDEALEWRFRRYHIIEEIVEYCPDIMCLQVRNGVQISCAVRHVKVSRNVPSGM
jgi:hypothetical protein